MSIHDQGRRFENMLIHGGRIIDPSQQFDAVGDLYISGGKIGWLSTGQTVSLTEDCAVIHAKGMVVCPGFIDIHCHLRQPGFDEKETIATGTRAAARGGFTTVCCMPNTNPPIDSAATVECVKNIASSEGVVRVLPVGCITKGRAGKELADFGELSTYGVIAFSDDGSPVSDSLLMRRALDYSMESGLPIIDHCEDLSLSRDGVVNKGTVSNRLGLKGIPAEAEEKAVARDIKLAGAAQGRLHIAHVSTAGSVDLIRCAREEGVSVTAEVTPHHLTLTEDIVDINNANTKVNPPLRSAEDLAALILGVKEGVIDIIATDHAPHASEDKTCGFAEAAFGISGFETALAVLLELVHRGRLSMHVLISKLTHQPALFLRRPDLGTIKPGAPADVIMFDPNVEWVVRPDDFVSKGKNTPIAGHLLKGRVMTTVFCGAEVYRDRAVKVDSMYAGAEVGRE